MMQVEATHSDGFDTKKTMVLSEVFPPQRGGSGKWLWEIYRRQTPQTYVMAVGDRFGADPSDSHYPQTVRRISLDMPYRGLASLGSLKNYSGQIRRVARMVRENHIEMIHASRPLSEGIVALAIQRLRKIPFLCYVHGEDINVASTSRELRAATGWVLRGAQMLIANSRFTQHLLTSEWGINASKVQLMHPGVDAERFASIAPSGTTESVPDSLKLLTVGRLQERKGQDTVIRAIPALLPVFPNLKYIIAGGGEDRARLGRIAESLGVSPHVRFVGEVSDEKLLELYADCDVFVLANRAVGKDVEGFGIVLLEAQAAGKPVIAGDSGGTCDTLVPGKTGFLVDCTNPDELVRLLKEELANPRTRERMGRVAQSHVSKRFDWNSLASQAEKTFRRAAGLE